MRIRKAVIPAAGLGTRFLPATKSQPKEMLPVVDKPAIQYVVEEAARAGITDILIVTGRGKRTIEDHFDRSFELEYYLERKGEREKLDEIRAISEMASIHYIRQGDPLGLGHAVLAAEAHVGEEPFAVLLGDDIIPDGSLLPRLLELFERDGRSVVAVEEVPAEETHLYGIVEPEFVEENLARIVDIVEKPSPGKAPSNLAAIGRYVFTPEIFDCLKQVGPGAGGEIQLTDGIRLLTRRQTVYAYVYDGVRFDIGQKLDYLRASVELALDHPEVGQDFAEFLRDLVLRRKII